MRLFKFLLLFSLFLTPRLFALEANLSVGAVTEFPLGIGAQGTLHLPQAQLHLNFRYLKFLSSYIDVMNETAQNLEFYNSATGDLVYEVLHNASMWEIGVGWSQTPTEGWYGDVGYSSMTGAGEATGATILEAVSGTSLPSGGNIYDLWGKVDSVVFRFGYKFTFNEYGSLHLAAGFLKPIATDTELDRSVSGPIQQAILDAANRELDEYLSETLENDVYIPLINVGWLYTF
jgi:hypothetical protein